VLADTPVQSGDRARGPSGGLFLDAAIMAF
jgi:hypothetical protein